MKHGAIGWDVLILVNITIRFLLSNQPPPSLTQILLVEKETKQEKLSGDIPSKNRFLQHRSFSDAT